MDRDEFTAKLANLATFTRNSDIAQYAKRADDKGDTHGVIITRRLQSDHVCLDCKEVCQGKPRRNFILRDGQWQESCSMCRRVRDTATGRMVNFGQANKTLVNK